MPCQSPPRRCVQGSGTGAQRLRRARNRRGPEPHQGICAEEGHAPTGKTEDCDSRRSGQHDGGGPAGPPSHDGNLLLHDPLRIRLQPEQQDYRAATIPLCHPALLSPHGRAGPPPPARDLHCGESRALGGGPRRANLLRRGGYASGHQQLTEHSRGLRLCQCRQCLQSR